eukprot:4083786-Amphidinium_carterae.2
MTVARRSNDSKIRVAYRPAIAPYVTICVVADVDSTLDLRRALAQLGTDFVAFWFLTFELQGFTRADADPDTLRGAAVRDLFKRCLVHINRVWEIAATPVGLLLPDVAQFVVLARPAYFMSPIAAGVDVQVLINSFLCEVQVAENLQSNIVALISADRTVSFVKGGAGGQKKRGLDSSGSGFSDHGDTESVGAQSLRNDAVFWPTWSSTAFAESVNLVILHVSVGDDPPVGIQVPDEWDQATTELYLARHVMCRREWLDIVWANNDVFIELNSMFPQSSSLTARAIATKVTTLPHGSSQRRSAKQCSEVIIGHRASRSYGISAYTTSNVEHSRELVQAVCEHVPEATFNALAVVRHMSVPLHRDSTNDPDSLMFILPVQVPKDAWIWVECESGEQLLDLEGEQVAGSWLPYNRLMSFPSSCAHMIHASSGCCSLALYRTGRVPRRSQIEDLVHLGFPLSSTELDRLDVPDEDDGDDCDTGAEPDMPLGADQPCAAFAHPGFEFVPMFKATVDGTYRKHSIRLATGSTVLDARNVLKRFLKLHVMKISLAQWDGRQPGCVLSDSDVLSKSSGPYAICIRRLPAASRRVPKCAAKKAVLSSLASTLPIGARAPLKKTEQQSRPAVPLRRAGAASTSALPREDGSSAVINEARVGDPAVQRLVDEGVLTTPFERWAAMQILQLASSHQQIIASLSSFSATSLSSAAESRTNAPTAIGAPSYQKPRTVIGQRSFVKGGGKRARNDRHSLASPSGNAILFTPSDDVVDTLMHCVRWIVLRAKRKLPHDPTDAHFHLRLLAKGWLCNAWRHGWHCAGQSIQQLASDLSCTVDDLIDVRCDPHMLSAPAFVVVFALSCHYLNQMFVLDKHGRRVDSFVACSGYGIQWIQSSWMVVSPVASLQSTERAAVNPTSPISISPTLPWQADSEADSQEIFELVHGAGKFQKVQHNAVSSTAYDLVIKDVKRGGATLFEPKFVKYVLDHDKKCTLACFQSRTSAQRIRAFAAGLKRMGLPEKVAIAESLLSQPAQAHASPGGTSHAHADVFVPPSQQADLEKRSSGESRDDWLQEPLLTPSGVHPGDDPSFAALRKRVDSIEVWAHTLDADRGTDSDSVHSAVRARELMEAMVKQILSEQRNEWQEQVESRIIVLEKKVETCLCSLGRLGDLEQALHDEKDATAVRLTTLSQQVDLCMRLCRRCVTGSSCSAASSSVREHDSSVAACQMRQVWNLLQVHSVAISRTWHWTASLAVSYTHLRAHETEADL